MKWRMESPGTRLWAPFSLKKSGMPYTVVAVMASNGVPVRQSWHYDTESEAYSRYNACKHKKENWEFVEVIDIDRTTPVGTPETKVCWERH